MKQKPTSNNSNLVVKIISAILILFAILCIVISITNKNYNLISGIIGLFLLIITMNIAEIIKINKDNAKIFNILPIILNIASIPLLFVQVIYSYVLVVPALIISKKDIVYNKNSKSMKIIHIISLILLIVCISFSIAGVLKK